jgi:hypothetical protein
MKRCILTLFLLTKLSAMDSDPVDSHAPVLIPAPPLLMPYKSWQRPFIFIDRNTQWMDNIYEYSLSDIPGIHYGYKHYPRVMRFMAAAGLICFGGIMVSKVIKKYKNE